MSKQDKNETKVNPRLKGTKTHKPCVDCGELKERLTAFKPRWGGCPQHKTDTGRRYFEAGCAECVKLVNGNIRQPRCIECDRKRSKKGRKSKKADPKPTPKVEAQPEPVVEAQPEPTPEPEPEPVATVEGQPEPSAESEDVTPEAAPAPKPKLASMSDLMADLSGLFGEGE